MSLNKVIFFSSLVVVFLSTNLNSQLSSDRVELLEKQVVRVINVQNTYEKEKRKLGSGTGFFIDSTGHIVTNAHVINDSYKINIYLGDAKDTEKVAAEIIKVSNDLDLALLKVNFRGLPAGLKIRSVPITKGTSVYSSGFPGSSDTAAGFEELFSSTLTNGIVSRIQNTPWVSSPIKREIIQHTTPINFGNSGGPLLDNCGNVAGVNTLKLIKDGVDGVSLALSSLELIKFLEQTNVKFIKVKSTCQDGNIFPRNYKDIDSNLLIWGVAIIFMIICSVGIFLLNQNPSKKTLYKMNTENDDENYSYFLSGFKKDGLPVRLKLKEDQLNRKYGIHIGRALDFTDNVIKSAEISRIHARIYNNQNGVFIEDLGSSNGIFINNKKINSFIPHQILLNDKLVFGDVELVLTN